MTSPRASTGCSTASPRTAARGLAGSYVFKQGNAAKLQLFQNSGGKAVADGVKLVRDNVADTDTDTDTDIEKKTFAYTYDPVNRIAKVSKTGSATANETYVHDDNANVINQTVKGVSTTFSYDRNRALSATVNGGVASYNYDRFGRLGSITGGGKVVQRNTYDGFDHVVEHSELQTDGSQAVTSYTFDPRSRRARWAPRSTCRLPTPAPASTDAPSGLTECPATPATLPAWNPGAW